MIVFNEIDPFACRWLRKLFPSDVVLNCDIGKLQAGGFVKASNRLHLFAGIGGWEYALGLAGWPADRPVWTGSCPCQPFSDAGKRLGTADERHLWPEMRRLIGECRPPTVFGEQVASKSGREWLSGVRLDLESLGYAVGAADLPAACVGSPHKRQRLFWVANDIGQRILRCQRGEFGKASAEVQGSDGKREQVWADLVSGGKSLVERMGDPIHPGWEGCRTSLGGEQRSGANGIPANTPGPWSDFDIVSCRDGKQRRVESGVFPLAHGVPERVGRLRGFGNAIVPQVAAVFIRSFLEAEAMMGVNPCREDR